MSDAMQLEDALGALEEAHDELADALDYEEDCRRALEQAASEYTDMLLEEYAEAQDVVYEARARMTEAEQAVEQARKELASLQ